MRQISCTYLWILYVSSDLVSLEMFPISASFNLKENTTTTKNLWVYNARRSREHCVVTCYLIGPFFIYNKTPSVHISHKLNLLKVFLHFCVEVGDLRGTLLFATFNLWLILTQFSLFWLSHLSPPSALCRGRLCRAGVWKLCQWAGFQTDDVIRAEIPQPTPLQSPPVTINSQWTDPNHT